MSKRLILVLGMALWLILFFFSCGNDDEDGPPSVNIPLAFFSPMAAGDYTVRITITAPDITNAILSEQQLAIVEGANRTYDVTVDNIPIGNKRGVKVEVFKDAKRLFEGSGTVNISSGENQLALRLEKVAELLSSEPQAGAQLLSTGSLTLNFSAPPGVVTVNGTQAVVQGNTASWKVPGLTAGSTALNIAWTAAGGGSHTLSMTIIGSPATIVLDPGSATLTAIGETVELSATVKDAQGQTVPGATVTWKSSNPSVARVGTEGLVTATGNGTATLIVTSGGQSTEATVTVTQAASSLTINPASATLVSIGETVQLSATVKDAKDQPLTGATVTWQSSNPSVANVNASGRGTATGTGSATITVTSGGKSATAVITVGQVSATLAITPSTTTLNAIGQTTQLTVTVRDANNNLIPGATVTWRSNNSAVVSVNSSGLVTARGSGSATITATSGGQSATAVITVGQVSATMAITPSTTTLTAIGQTAQLTVTVRDANNNPITGANISWRSNNSAVANVNSTGWVTARGNGNTTITATSGGKSATAVITVSQSLATIAVTPPSATLNAIGQTTQLTATVRDANNNLITGANISWRSNNSAVANVNSTGRVTARGNGNTTITATSGGKSATAVITVGQSAATLVVTPSITTLNAVGQTVQLTATVRDANNNPIPGTTVTWRSNNSAVANVNSTGGVTARGNGNTTITVTSGGQSATAVITVSQASATLAITPSTATLNAVGQTTQLTATVRDANNNPITGASVSWSSSNPSVASVSAAGLVTAHGNGSTEIQVRSGNLSQAITITVVVREEAVPATPAGMVLIPAGEFQMGSNNGGDSDERPVHTVYVDAFFMDIYEVTNAQYKQFVDANPQWGKDRIPSSYHNGDYLEHWNGNSYPPGKANHPVVYVSWYSAMAYSQWAGKRLPTEAEWERAARGGLVGKKYPWGDSLLDSSKANYNNNVGDTTPVGSYPPNGYGLYDMAGNVSEWCLDKYEADFYARSPRDNPIAGGSITDIINNFTSVTSSRVLRGGSWGTDPSYLHVANRNWYHPAYTFTYEGFRCARAQ